MTQPIICIAGKNEIAVESLRFLVDLGWKDQIIVCPNKSDEGVSTWQPSLSRFAREFGIPIVTLETAHRIENMVFISLEFDRILKPLDFQSNRLYNIHFSALPAYKGMYTSAHPILHGDIISGVTLHEIDYGIDTGPIVSQRLFELPTTCTARDLYFLYMNHGLELFKDYFPKLVLESLPYSEPQEASGSTYFSKASIKYAGMDFELRGTANDIATRLRAFSFREYQLPIIGGIKIGGWKILPCRSKKPIGHIVRKNIDSLVLSSVDYDIELTRDRSWDWCFVKSNTNFRWLNELKITNIDTRDRNGWTPLIKAAYNGNAQLCHILLEHGASPNLGNMNGTTPLMYAFSGKQAKYIPETVKTLVKFGADDSLYDHFGKSLRDYHSE